MYRIELYTCPGLVINTYYFSARQRLNKVFDFQQFWLEASLIINCLNAHLWQHNW